MIKTKTIKTIKNTQRSFFGAWLLIELFLILMGGEAEGGEDDVAGIEFQCGSVPEECAGVGVFVLAAKFLQKDG